MPKTITQQKKRRSKKYFQQALVAGAAWILTACAVSHNNPEGTNRHEVTIHLGSDDEEPSSGDEQEAAQTHSSDKQEPSSDSQYTPSSQDQGKPSSEGEKEEMPASQRRLQKDLEWQGEFYMEGLKGPDHHRLKNQKQDRGWSQPPESDDSGEDPLVIDPR